MDFELRFATFPGFKMSGNLLDFTLLKSAIDVGHFPRVFQLTPQLDKNVPFAMSIERSLFPVIALVALFLGFAVSSWFLV